MKYMGSKRAMLQNGLGDLLTEHARDRDRIVDLFCGSASVAWFAAQKFNIPVFATDLQRFSVLLARSVLGRTEPIEQSRILANWFRRSKEWRQRKKAYYLAKRLDNVGKNIGPWAREARRICSDFTPRNCPIWTAYGGYYFSPSQAITIDSLLATLPSTQPQRVACHAALVVAASRCAASPGHTAQPFKPNATAGKYLREAWQKDIWRSVEEASKTIFASHARQVGRASVQDANQAAKTLCERDLVFIDPPYSGVHYSRFYHVLETVAAAQCGPVDGAGRYPSQEERPFSSYSRTTESRIAFENLLSEIASQGCVAIVTFPKGDCSNGLSGTVVEELCAECFAISRRIVKTRFSTLGGNNTNRDSRQLADELVLLLKPKA